MRLMPLNLSGLRVCLSVVVGTPVRAGEPGDMAAPPSQRSTVSADTLAKAARAMDKGGQHVADASSVSGPDCPMRSFMVRACHDVE